jgi:hypothetical protein
MPLALIARLKNVLITATVSLDAIMNENKLAPAM